MALAALLPLASAEAQPRSKDTGKAKQQTQREERADFHGQCCAMGPGGGARLGHREGFGRPGMGPGGPGAGWGGRGLGLMQGDGPLADRLKLTAEQRKKLRDLGPTHRREMVRLRADLETAQIDLQEAMRDDATDARGVDQRIDALAALHAKRMKAMAAHWREVRSILTPAQRTKLRDLRPGRGGRPDMDEEDED
jgi:Spy/CpxP family protein refolding chaperone